MICVGTSSLQFRWELQRCPARIHHRRRGRNCEKQQQLHRDVNSSLEVPPISLPNFPSLPPQKIETTGRFCAFTAPLGFRHGSQQRKWDIIDLVAQDIGSDTRRGGAGSGNPPYASSLRQSSKKLTFALPAGRPYELRKWQSVRKVLTSVRAERISKERRNDRSPDSQRDREIQEDDGEGLAEDTSMWDSNAEGIRRGRFKRRSSVKSEVPLSDRPQKQPQELEYDDAEVRSRIPRNWSQRQQQQQWEFDDAEPRMRARFQEEEWDYDAEGSNRNRTARSRKPQAESSGWKQSSDDYDSYGYDGETGEASAGFQDWSSWINTDVKDAFLFIRWGLPAAVLLVPWLMGNPLMLLVGLSFIPAANNVIFPIVGQIFRTVMSGGSPPRPRRKRKQSTASASSSRRSQAQRTSTFYEREAPAASTSTSSSDSEADLFSSVATTIFGELNDDDLPRKPPRLGVRSSGTGVGTKGLGGWEDLEEDRARARMERWPTERRSTRSEKKIVKREQNIFIRLILALFPFLRFWGGLM